MLLLNGKQTAADIRSELKGEIRELTAKTGRAPCLSVILVGEDPASQVYVRNKEKACKETGILSRTIRFDASVSQAELEETIHGLNRDEGVDGILLQLPLPENLDSQRCLERISPDKDVDGFHPVSMGRLILGLPGFRSCTPAGIITLLQRHGLSLEGKKAVVIGRSNIVGKPLSLLLLQKHATVTLCHSKTSNLSEETGQADFLFAAIGRPKFVTREMVKPGAVVVDVGINRTKDGLAGDCDFEGLRDVASAMTPVPGGVGPMTIAQLLLNTTLSFKLRTGKE